MDKKPETENSQLKIRNELNQLTHIFPFLLSQKNISNTEEIPQTNEEFQNIVKDIVKNETNTQINDYLKGEENIIENMIIKYGNITKKDISNLNTLTLQIPNNFGMLNDFGFYLPKLKNLNLSNSKIKSIDEIGTSFTNLESLNVSHCELEDLSGIICFIHLIELDASHNKIDDLVELEMCSTIQILKLNDNNIQNEDNFSFLISLQNLHILHIKNNPFIKFISNWNFDQIQLDLN